MKIGYSKYARNSEKLIEQLENAGCDDVVIEKQLKDSAKGEAIADRPNLFEKIDEMNPGDVLVVSQLSHLVNNFLDFAQLLQKLSEKQIKLESIEDGIDSEEKMDLFDITKAFSTMERKLNRDRVHLGMKLAQKAKRFPGRRVQFTENHDKVLAAADYYKQGHTMVYIARTVEIPRSSLYRIKQEHSHLFDDKLRAEAKES